MKQEVLHNNLNKNNKKKIDVRNFIEQMRKLQKLQNKSSIKETTTEIY